MNKASCVSCDIGRIGVFDEAILDDKGEILSIRENCKE